MRNDVHESWSAGHGQITELCYESDENLLHAFESGMEDVERQ
jgi:hypothetical protein